MEKLNIESIGFCASDEFLFITEKINEIIDYINNQKPKRTSFTPPTITEIKEYCNSRCLNVDAVDFFNFYESKGWMVGKSKMKKWKSTISLWHSRNTKKPKKLKTFAEKESDNLTEIMNGIQRRHDELGSSERKSISS